MRMWSSKVRRAGAAAIAGTVVAAGVITAVAPPASAAQGFALARFAGDTRFDTARLAALETFPTPTPTAVIATGREFADALAGSFLAGALRAPLLLTEPTEVPDATFEALEDLQVKDVYLLGGPSAISTAVENHLEATDSTSADGGKIAVTRVDGANRFETAAEIAALGAQGGVGLLDGKRTALLGNGFSFADALAAGPIAYSEDFPVLLTETNTLPQVTNDTLTELDIEHVIILGGTAAVGAPVRSAIEGKNITVRRINGVNRYDTARNIAEFAITTFGFKDSHVNVVSGEGFADALPAGTHGGEEDPTVVLLTRGTILAAETEDFLGDFADTLIDGHLFGGVAAVTNAVETAAEEAAQGESNVARLTITPSANATLSASTTEGDAVDRGRREFTITAVTADGNPAEDQEIDIVLVRGPQVTPVTGGFVFGDNNPDNARADLLQARFGYIEEVNGLTQPATTKLIDNLDLGADGAATIAIDSVTPEVVRLVAFFDSADDDTLTLSDTDMPVPAEVYGVGGRTSWEPEIPPGGVYQGEVVGVNVDEGTYFLDLADSGDGIADVKLTTDTVDDTFAYNDGTVLPITGAEFLGSISARANALPGDVVSANFNPDGPSSHQIAQDVPGPVAGLTAVLGDAPDDIEIEQDALLDDVRIAFTRPPNRNVSAYRVERVRFSATGVELDRTSVACNQDAPFGGGDFVTIAQQVTCWDLNVFDPFAYFIPPMADGQTVLYAVTPLDTAGTNNPVDMGPTVRTTNPIPLPDPPDLELPHAIASVITDDGDGVFGDDDVLRIEFSENLANPAASAALVLTDLAEDGTIARIRRGTNAAFTVNGSSLTITMTGPPTFLASGNDGFTNPDPPEEPVQIEELDIPAIVMTASGISDTRGNPWVPGDRDKPPTPGALPSCTAPVGEPGREEDESCGRIFFGQFPTNDTAFVDPDLEAIFITSAPGSLEDGALEAGDVINLQFADAMEANEALNRGVQFTLVEDNGSGSSRFSTTEVIDTGNEDGLSTISLIPASQGSDTLRFTINDLDVTAPDGELNGLLLLTQASGITLLVADPAADEDAAVAWDPRGDVLDDRRALVPGSPDPDLPGTG